MQIEKIIIIMFFSKMEKVKMKLKLDFSNNFAAQDMINIIMNKENLSDKDAVEEAINYVMYNKIVKTGWASIAFNLWGHGDPERKWSKLKNPIIEIDIDSAKQQLIFDIAKRENVDTETAVGYFLIFVMESFGYHI